jgi:ADP-ribose pyrophosphatase YjhB (NUDIX family)
MQSATVTSPVQPKIYTAPKVRVYAKVLVTDPLGRVLLLRRSNTHPTKALQWDLPGGVVNYSRNERPPAAARREVREETGLELGDVRAVRLLTTMEQTEKIGAPPCYGVGIICLAEARSDVVKLSSEHDDFAWADDLSWSALIDCLRPKYAALVWEYITEGVI